jgi:hypothetical protein
MMGQALHRARFAHLDEVWPLLSAMFPFDGILLGTRRFLLSRRLVTVRKTKQRPELGNLLIVAPTRSGKGLLAVSQLLTWHHIQYGLDPIDPYCRRVLTILLASEW